VVVVRSRAHRTSAVTEDRGTSAATSSHPVTAITIAVTSVGRVLRTVETLAIREGMIADHGDASKASTKAPASTTHVAMMTMGTDLPQALLRVAIPFRCSPRR
jgi:hypothetical protein